MRQARRVLAGLRRRCETLAGEAQLPLVLGVLRRMNPFVFEELILHGFADRGWRVQRNTSYILDGGTDGTFWFEGDRFLVQVKRYRYAIDPAHLEAFIKVVERQQAAGGVFVHTGSTCPHSRELVRQHSRIVLLSGARLVSFLLDGERPEEAGKPE